MLSTSIFKDRSHFEKLRPVWDNLVARDPKAKLCNTYEWCAAWMNQYWDDACALYVLIIYLDNHPCGLIPLYFNKSNTNCFLIGSGEPEEIEAASEYLDAILDLGSADNEIIYAFIARELLKAKVSIIQLINCSDDSHLLGICRHLKKVIYEKSGQVFRLSLAGSYEQIRARFSKNFQKKSRELVNRFKNEHALFYSGITKSISDSEWIDLKELHTKSWKFRGKSGAMVSDIFSNFHKELKESNGKLDYFYTAIAIKGDTTKPIAVNYYYTYKDFIYFYLSGVDPSIESNISLGHLLHIMSIRELAGQNLTYDFMKGSLKDSYKQRFCKPSGYFYTITIYGSRIESLYFYYIHRMKRSLLKIFSGFKSREINLARHHHNSVSPELLAPLSIQRSLHRIC